MFEMDISYFLDRKISEVKEEIKSQKENYILSCEFDELVTYFYDKNKLEEIILAKKPEYEWKEPNDSEQYYTLLAKYYITSGNEMLQYKPTVFSSFLGRSPWPLYRRSLSNDNLEWYEFSTKCSLEELESILQEDGAKEKYENNAFASIYSVWYRNIIALNSAIINHNKYLVQIIKNELSEYISLAQRKVEVRNKLKISMMPISDIRNKKVALKVVEKKKSITMPEIVEPYYYISNEDYNLIIQILYRCMIQYERTPNTFSLLDEEDIRNVIIGAVNANFEFDSTAESFSNTGHTDIMITVSNKAAFIAECKLWKGPKYISDGINQLLGYTTYKDGKLALLVFNKDNKDFTKVISEMDNLIKNNDKYVSCISHENNKWECLFESNHSGTVKITFIVSNYHFEK